MRPNTSNIAGRMANFFERQIAVLDEMREELPALKQVIESDAQAAAVEFHRRREHALAILAKEFELLKREWNDTEGLTPEERSNVEQLSAKAQNLIAELQPMVSTSITFAQEKMEGMTSSMNELRRGKQVMQAYKTREPGEGGGLDRQG